MLPTDTLYFVLQYSGWANMIFKIKIVFFIVLSGLLLCSCKYPFQPSQFVLPPPNFIFPSKSGIQNFVGSANVKLAFTLTTTVSNVYFLDYNNYNDSAFLPQQLKKPKGMESFNCARSRISPDGLFVAYYLAAGTTTYGAYIQRLDTAATPVLVDAGGAEPHWWQDNTGVYIIYSNVILVPSIGGVSTNIGQTFKRKVDLTGNGAVSGTATVIAPYPMNGGLSADGQYLCTGYMSAAFYNLSDSTLVPINLGRQTCNPSIDPDTAHTGWMMFLNFGGVQTMNNPFIGASDYPDSLIVDHSVLFIVDYTNTVRDYVALSLLNKAYGGYSEWQTPEWSNNPQFAAALGVINDNQADGIIIKNIGNHMATKTFLKFTLGKGKLNVESRPYIWIGK